MKGYFDLVGRQQVSREFWTKKKREVFTALYNHDDREQMIIDHDDNDDNDTIPVSDVLHLGDDNCTSLMSKCCRANSGWLEIRKETNKKCILVPLGVEI